MEEDDEGGGGGGGEGRARASASTETLKNVTRINILALVGSNIAPRIGFKGKT